MLSRLVAHIRRHYIGFLALAVALSGTAYAAALPRNSVTTKQVRNGSLLAKDFKQGQLPAGEQGPQGPPGQDATKLWAVVDSAGNLLRGSGAVSAAAVSGGYDVIFNRDVTACAYQATLGSAQAEVGQVGVGPRNGTPDGVYVYTTNSAGAQEAHGFNVAVFC